jgi:hypothetical protein
MAETATKRCSCCKNWLPVSGFYKDKATRDGYNNYCKICSNLKRGRKPHFLIENPQADIDSWDQVESVLQAIAEYDLEVELHTKELHRQIKLLKRDYTESVEPLLLCRINLEKMLSRFIFNSQPVHELFERKYKFGTIKVCCGYMTIKLDRAATRACLNKP